METNLGDIVLIKTDDQRVAGVILANMSESVRLVHRYSDGYLMETTDVVQKNQFLEFKQSDRLPQVIEPLEQKYNEYQKKKWELL